MTAKKRRKRRNKPQSPPGSPAERAPAVNPPAAPQHRDSEPQPHAAPEPPASAAPPPEPASPPPARREDARHAPDMPPRPDALPPESSAPALRGCLANAVIVAGLLALAAALPGLLNSIGWRLPAGLALIASAAAAVAPRIPQARPAATPAGAIALILAIAALAAAGTGPRLLLLPAACIALAAAHRVTGLALFNILGAALSLLVFAAALFMTRAPGAFALGPLAIPVAWAAALPAAAAFLACAALHDHAPRLPGTPPNRRRRPFNPSPRNAALLHALAAGALLLAAALLQPAANMALPFLLGLLAAAIAIAGAAANLRHAAAASALLLAGAFAAHFLFLYLPRHGYDMQPYYVLYTLGLAAIAFAIAFPWARCLETLGPPRGWDYHAAAALPAAAAVLLLASLIPSQFPGLAAPGCLAIAGAAIAAAGAPRRRRGIQAAGLLAIALAARRILQDFREPLVPSNALPAYLAVLLLLLAAIGAAIALRRASSAAP